MTNHHFLRKFFRNPLSATGLVLIIGLVAMALLAPWIAPFDPYTQSLRSRLEAPTSAHLLGTDYYGRDVLSRLIYGARYSLSVGLVSILIGSVTGTTFGVLAGYFGGVIDRVLVAILDVLMAFPGMLLALTIVGFLGPSLFNVMIAVGVWSVPIFARVIRANTLAVRGVQFVEAARANGCGHTRIILKHILPESISAILVLCSFRMSSAILTAAGLSFLGLGAQPPMPEWGAILNESRSVLRQAPWISIYTGCLITLTVVSFNLVGDTLRDILDPRM
jgi:peptide/nickel transport system permease protein